MPARLAQQEGENLQTSQVSKTCEVSDFGVFLGGGTHFSSSARKHTAVWVWTSATTRA